MFFFSFLWDTLSDNVRFEIVLYNKKIKRSFLISCELITRIDGWFQIFLNEGFSKNYEEVLREKYCSFDYDVEFVNQIKIVTNIKIDLFKLLIYYKYQWTLISINAKSAREIFFLYYYKNREIENIQNMIQTQQNLFSLNCLRVLLE